MLTPSQRRCKDAQNPPRNPVGKASQSVVQSLRQTVGNTPLKAIPPPRSSCDGTYASRARVYIGTDLLIPAYAEHRVDPTL